MNFNENALPGEMFLNIKVLECLERILSKYILFTYFLLQFILKS